MPVETGLKCPALIGTRQSGLTREQIHGSLHTASGDVKGRYWLALLVGLCVLVAIGANVFP